MNGDELETGEKVTMGGALLVVFGTFLPWPSGGVAIAGDGIFVALFAALTVVLVTTGDWEREIHLAVLGLGVLTVLVALTSLPDPGALANSGDGLYLTVAGGVAVAVGGVFGVAVRRDPERAGGPRSNR